MGKIDFDAQRAEAGLTGHEITVAGRDVELPAILSLRFGQAMGNGDLEDALTVLVGVPDDNGEFVADHKLVAHLFNHLGIDDLNQIAEELYGLTDPTDPTGDGPNREARRAGSKKKGKQGGARG